MQPFILGDSRQTHAGKVIGLEVDKLQPLHNGGDRLKFKHISELFKQCSMICIFHIFTKKHLTFTD